MANLTKITPCLWFDDQGEEAAGFYTAIFQNSRIVAVTLTAWRGRGHEGQGRMTVEFELDGHTFTALNGGPVFRFNEAISFQVNCETQAEIDYFWEKLSGAGTRRARAAGSRTGSACRGRSSPAAWTR